MVTSEVLAEFNLMKLTSDGSSQGRLKVYFRLKTLFA